MRLPALLPLLLLIAMSAEARPWWMRGAPNNDTDFLPPEVAFRVGATVQGSLLHVRWVIADGYYLYRSKVHIEPDSPDLHLGTVSLPPGLRKSDPYLGDQDIFQREVEVTVPFSRTDAGAHPLQLRIGYQGCAEAGLCYPPISKVLFPQPPAAPATTDISPWVVAGTLGGLCAFLAAGLALRKGRALESPPA